MIAPEPRQHWLRQHALGTTLVDRIIIVMILLIGVIGSVAVALLAYQTNVQMEQHRLKGQNDQYVFQLKQIINSNIENLYSLRAFFAASDHVSAIEFRAFSSAMLRYHPEVKSLLWAPHTPAPDTQAQALYPIRFVNSSIDRNGPYGFDLSDLDGFTAVNQKAIDSGLPQIMIENPDPLSETQSPVLMIVLAAYNTKRAPLSIETRRKRFTGFVVALVDLNFLFGIGGHETQSAHPSIRINDITPTVTIQQLYISGVDRDTLQSVRPLQVANRQWQITFNSPHDFLHYLLPGPISLLISGVLITLLLAYYTSSNVQKRRQVEHQDDMRSREMNRLKNDMQQIMQNTGEGIFVLDTSGLIRYANRATLDMTGFTEPEMLGSSYSILFANDNEREDAGACLDSVLLNDSKTITERYFKTKQGNSLPVECVVTAMLTPEQHTRGAIVAFRDISQRLQHNRELNEARFKAEAASQAKSSFLAAISHEIRTPMNGILGMAQLLADSSLSEEQREYVDVMLKSGDALVSQVESILEFSSMDMSQIQLLIKQFDLRELCEELMQSVYPKARSKGLAVEFNCEITSTGQVIGDKLRIRQLLTNLISNAIKFTQQGTIGIRVEEQDIDAANAMYRIEISDTGIGIAAEQLPHLFNSFSQADSGITRQYGGTGLGLAICRKLTDLMGATIEVRSELGQGSRFTIQLPLPRARGNSTIQFSEDQPMTDKLIINTEQLRKMSGLMKDMFDELIPAYIDTGEKNLQAIENALATDDMKTAQRLFHSMKSASLNVGAEALSKQAADLEVLARAGQQAEVSKAMKQFKQDFAEVVKQLRQFRISA